VEAEKNKSKVKTASPSSSPAPLPTSTTKFTGDPEKRNFKADGVGINRTDRESRNNCIGLLYNGLAFRSTEPNEVILSKAIEVEHAALKQFKGETDAYRAKLRSLFQNLKNRSNPGLAKQVLAGDIAPEKFVVMTPEELKPEALKKLEKSLEKENMKKAQVPMAEKSISDALQCGKCKQKKVSYSQAQTRSADEPMTTFCECTVCGNRWKVSYSGQEPHHGRIAANYTASSLSERVTRRHLHCMGLFILLAI
jgi:transcription elongation factor S-II